MGFIYQILNAANEKRYIGRTTNLKSRKNQHFTALRKGKHHSNHLQYAWNKYGEDSFLFEILEECGDALLPEREAYWINHYQSSSGEYGYNIDKFTDKGEMVRSESTKEKLSKASSKYGRGYIGYNGNTGVVTKYDTKMEVIKASGKNSLGTKFFLAENWFWCETPDYENTLAKFIEWTAIERNTSKTVFCFCKVSHELLHVFESVAQAARSLSLKEERIRECLRKIPVVSRKGFLFSTTSECPEFSMSRGSYSSWRGRTKEETKLIRKTKRQAKAALQKIR